MTANATRSGISGSEKSNAPSFPAHRMNIAARLMWTTPPAIAFTPHREAASTVLAPAFCMKRRLRPMPPMPAGVIRLTNDPAKATSTALNGRTGTGHAAMRLIAAPT